MCPSGRRARTTDVRTAVALFFVWSWWARVRAHRYSAVRCRTRNAARGSLACFRRLVGMNSPGVHRTRVPSLFALFKRNELGAVNSIGSCTPESIMEPMIPESAFASRPRAVANVRERLKNVEDRPVCPPPPPLFFFSSNALRPATRRLGTPPHPRRRFFINHAVTPTQRGLTGKKRVGVFRPTRRSRFRLGLVVRSRAAA